MSHLHLGLEIKDGGSQRKLKHEWDLKGRSFCAGVEEGGDHVVIMEHGQHLAAKTSTWWPASKDSGPWSHNWRKLNSANNLIELCSRFFPKTSRWKFNFSNTLTSDFEPLNRTYPLPHSISNLGMSEAGNLGRNSVRPASGLTVAHIQVLTLIKACPRPEGLHFKDLKNQQTTVVSIK